MANPDGRHGVTATKTLYRRVRYEVRDRMAQYPVALPLFKLLRPKRGATLVGPGTDLLIQGWPRSANTFCYQAFRQAQTREMAIAHHLHAPGLVIAAVRRNVPALVLVRRPRDAVASFLQRESHIAPRQALRSWIRFYARLVPYRSGFVTATFDQATTDFGEVIARLNATYGTRFDRFEHNEENVAACFAAIERGNADRYGGGRIVESHVARPSSERSARKRAIVEALDAPELAAAVADADRMFERYAAWATVPVTAIADDRNAAATDARGVRRD